MNQLSFVASLVWAAVAVLFLIRLNQFAREWLAIKNKISEGPPDIVIPDDLMGLALGETEKWAQDQTVEVIRERYDRLRDWNKVRAAVGVAQVSS